MDTKEKEKYYSVQVEGFVPVKLKYRVLAISPEEALENYTKGMGKLSSPPELKTNQIKKTIASIYDWGTNMIRYTKRF